MVKVIFESGASEQLRNAIAYLVVEADRLGVQLTRTGLVKLLFLADLRAKEQLGSTISGATYKYYTYGPFAPEIIDAIAEMDGREIVEETRPHPTDTDAQVAYHYAPGKSDLPSEALDANQRRIIREVLHEYGALPLQTLLRHVYDTEPMRDAQPLQVVLNDAA